MDLRTLNLEEAKTKETFGGVAITSGACALDIMKVDKATAQNGATSLNFEIKINGARRFTTMWMNSVDDKSNLVTNEYNSTRLKHLLILLKIDPSTLTEVATDKQWLVNIPQLKGTVGAVIEVTPANTKYNKKEFPKINISSFYILSTMQTIKEYNEKKPAEVVEKEVAKLLAKEYISIAPQQQSQQSAPSQFDVGSDLTDEDLPF